MKIFVLLVFFIVFPSLLMAQSQVEERRIEEQKRDSLRPSETRMVEEKKAIPPPLDPIDLLYFEPFLKQ